MQMKENQILKLANNLKTKFPEIFFAYIFGSAARENIDFSSDIDIAVYLKPDSSSTRLIAGITGIVEEQFTGYSCDLVILNNAGVILAMEALRGKIIYIREEEKNSHADFYSSICRSYEYETAWREKQLRYRGYEVQWNY